MGVREVLLSSRSDYGSGRVIKLENKTWHVHAL